MNKKILQLAIPNILSNLAVPLAGAIDIALMGRQAGVTNLDAVALGALIFSFLYWSFGFLRMGTTGLVAQAFGRKDPSEQALVLLRGLLVALMGALGLWLLQWPVSELGFWLLSGPVEVEEAAQRYFYIRIWAAPATIGLYVFTGWFLGMQNAVYAMWIAIVVNLSNALLSIFFVEYLGFQVEGVALGTVAAQYLGLFLAVGLWRYKYRQLLQDLPIDTRAALTEPRALKRFWALNRDIFIRTFALIFGMSFFTDRSAAAGERILAINTVLLQFVTWMAYAIDGFAFAAESLVGEYAGAKNRKGLRRALRYIWAWAMGAAVLISVLYAAFGETFLFLFVSEDKADLVAQAKPYLWWVILMPIVATPCYIWDGVFIGLTASVAMRNTMLMALAMYLLAYWIMIPGLGWGNHALWGCLTLFMAARGIWQALWQPKVFGRLDF